MERSRISRFLRIAVTALSLTACVLLVGLWVRSYYFADVFTSIRSSTKVITVVSCDGRLMVCSTPQTIGHKPGFVAARTASNSSLPGPPMPYWGVHFHHAPMQWTLTLWYWSAVIPTVIIALLASYPWLRWRFSLRTLLIAMTLVAVALGIFVVSS